MRINSHNEWTKLREVVVGTVSGFSPPLEVEGDDEAKLAAAQEVVMRAYPKWYLDEVAEDLEGIASVLAASGAKVHRPEWREARTSFRTPNWLASGFDIYNMRDLHAVFGNTLVSSAPSSRFRLFEHYALQKIIYEHYFADELTWIHAPPPRLVGEYLKAYERPVTKLELEEDRLHKDLSLGLTETFHRLEEHEIVFDAANVIRLGKDVLYLVSSTGNRLAGKWLQSILGRDYRLHATNAYRSSHLDSTIMPLRAGFVLMNRARVNRENCPELFKNWEAFYFGDVAPLPEEEVNFHRDVRLPVFKQLHAMGVACNLEHISSPWAGINVFSIDPETVLVHDRQIEMIRQLEQKKFTVIPIRMRHCYSMLGGLHCSTLDLVRDGGLEDYT